MSNYDQLTLELIPGETPKERYETAQKIIQILTEIAYPRRDSPEEDKSLINFAVEIEQIIKL